jgi:alpha/beta superfamily hydrolase
MVERGQVLERMTLVHAGDVELEGLYQRGAVDPPAMPVVLAAPHPRLGGSMDSPVLAEVVWQLARRGHPTLRFNWRGIGASPGAINDDTHEAATDLAAAVDQLAPQGPAAVVGYSFGAAAAALVAASHPRVERVVLIAPPVDRLVFDFAALSTSGVVAAAVVGSEDAWAPPDRVRAAAGPSFPIHVVAGASHSFIRGLAELGRRVAELLPGSDRE